MSVNDLISVFQWWAYIFVLGLIFTPITKRVFSGFLDKGYQFSKIIGIIIISYITFVLGVLHIAPFTQITIFAVIFALALGITISLFIKPAKTKLTKSGFFLIFFEEVIFLLGLVLWSFIRAHQPDIFGLEKYMDFGFVNSLLRTTYFPPRDMWYTPLPINYYYFGHLITAILTKLSGIPSDITFNLMIATLFSFSFSLAFSLVGNVWHTYIETKKKVRFSLLHFIPAGLIGGFLVTLGGNLHTVYTLFTPYQNDNPVPFWKLIFSPSTFPNNYWYPNATRFIYHTIHEFPSYSFVVSDLHGHVLDIPIVLTALAVLLAITVLPATKTTAFSSRKSFLLRITTPGISMWIFYGFLLGIMYMTNAWDGMIYTLVSIPIIIYKNFQQGNTFVKSVFSFEILQRIFLLVLCLLFFSLPFSFFFKPGELVGGIGLICAPQFLIQIGNIGPFVFEPNHCMHSPLWQLLILYGFFIFWLISFIFLLFKDRKKLVPSDIFVATLSGMAIFLIIIPEFFYLRDIYTTYFRANTMFKLVYQAFILFSLSISFMMFRYASFLKSRTIPFWKRLLLFPYTLIGLIFFALVCIYPYFAIMSYYNNLTTYQGLIGTTYLSKNYPNDALGIVWINTHISGQPVILEAAGDSYTEYARVSSNTGLPTILGWPVHEWLWRGTYDIIPPRTQDIQTMYDTKDVKVFTDLAKKYKVQYVFVGQLERTKYPNLSEDKFQQAGKVVFRSGGTTIYQLSL